MKLGNTTISSIFKGNTEISKIYKGTLVVYEAFRKLITNGVPPITLVNCQESKLIDLKINGNSVQNVKVTNLYDGTYTSGEYYNAEGILTKNDAVSMSSMYKISYNKYECYFDTIQAAVIRINFFDSAKNWIGQEILDETFVVKEDIFNVPSKARYLNFSVLTSYMELEHIIQPSIDAVPTYDFPIEVESVGDKTVNLFDISKAQNGSVLTSNGRDYDPNNGGTNRVRTGYIYLTAGNYVLSTTGSNKDITFGSSCHRYSIKDDETSWLGQIPTSSIISTGDKNYRTFTLEVDCYCRFVLLPITGSPIKDLSLDIVDRYKPQIEVGDVPTNYEPYGYKIPVEFTSTLYDFSLNKIAPYDYNNEGLIRYGFDLGILEAGQYTINFEYSEYPAYLYLRWKDANGDFGTHYLTTIQSDKQRLPVTFTADGSSNFYVLCASSSINTLQKAKNLWSNVTFACLQKGSSIQHKITNLYLNEPLRKINYHEDKIFYADKK